MVGPERFPTCLARSPPILVWQVLTFVYGCWFLQAEVAYSDVQEALEIGDKEVEVWIIDAIRGNLVDARMDQLQQKMIVRYVGRLSSLIFHLSPTLSRSHSCSVVVRRLSSLQSYLSRLLPRTYTRFCRGIPRVVQDGETCCARCFLCIVRLSP